MYIGINLGHHDTSIGVLKESGDEFELMVLEEERLTKNKNAGFYPFLSLDYVQKNLPVNELAYDQVAFSTFFMDVKQTWEHLDTLNSKYKELIQISPQFKRTNTKAANILHHEAHLFSCLISLDPKEDYLIVVSDGCGSRYTDLNKLAIFPFKVPEDNLVYETISVYSYSSGEVKVLDKILTPVHLARGKHLDFSPASHFTGASQVVFGDWQYSGKVMGLAGYYQGDLFDEDELFNVLTKTKFNEKASKKDFDEMPDEKFKFYAKVSASTQNYFEQYMMKLFKNLAAKNPKLKNLVYAGGTALNCIFNEKLRNENVFKTIWVPAWTNDEGVGIGTAVGAYYLKHKKLPKVKNARNPFLGIDRRYSEAEVKAAFPDCSVEKLDLRKAAKLISENEIIAWCEGRSECGPRALGHRSILCNPFIPGIRDYLNDQIKMREKFRPYGCSVLETQQGKYFENAEGLYSPYMSFAPVVREEQKERLKEIMHVDQTIRIQTVDDLFPRMKSLLENLNDLTGDSLIIHTSLNINKQPILETLEDASKFLRTSKLKYLVFEDYLILKVSNVGTGESIPSK